MAPNCVVSRSLTAWSLWRFITLCLATAHTSNQTGGCEIRKQIQMKVHAGWPISFNCQNLLEERAAQATEDDPTDSHDAKCFIVNNETNTTLWEEKIEVGSWYNYDYSEASEFHMETNLNQSRRYRVYMKVINSTCYYDEVLLNFTTAPELTCKKAEESTKHVDFQGSDSVPKVLTCGAVLNDQPAIHLDHMKHNYTVTWYRNCSELDAGLFPQTYRKEGDKLYVHKLSYELAGVYSCAFTYKGMTKFATHYDVCVKEKEAMPDAMLLSCPKKVTGRFGDAVSIECTASLGIGRINTLFLSGKWEQSPGSHRCWNVIEGSSNGTEKSTECALENTHEVNEKCFLYNPPEAEKTPKENIWKMSFNIRHFGKKDVGNYSASIMWFDTTATADVWLDQNASLTNIYLYLIVGLSVFIFVIIILATAILTYKRTRK